MMGARFGSTWSLNVMLETGTGQHRHTAWADREASSLVRQRAALKRNGPLAKEHSKTQRVHLANVAGEQQHAKSVPTLATPEGDRNANQVVYLRTPLTCLGARLGRPPNNRFSADDILKPMHHTMEVVGARHHSDTERPEPCGCEYGDLNVTSVNRSESSNREEGSTSFNCNQTRDMCF